MTDDESGEWGEGLDKGFKDSGFEEWGGGGLKTGCLKRRGLKTGVFEDKGFEGRGLADNVVVFQWGGGGGGTGDL